MTDRALIKAAQRGSADAVERLVRSYWPDAHRIALGIVADPGAAEDVAQESLLAAIRALSDFDRQRPFRPWLHRIVVNRSLDLVRVRARRAEVELDSHSLEASANGAGETVGMSDDLLSALRALAPQERAIVVLRHLLDLNSREIGQVLDLAEGTVRAALSRSLARLRAQLDQEALDRG